MGEKCILRFYYRGVLCFNLFNFLFDVVEKLCAGHLRLRCIFIPGNSDIQLVRTLNILDENEVVRVTQRQFEKYWINIWSYQKWRRFYNAFVQALGAAQEVCSAYPIVISNIALLLIFVIAPENDIFRQADVNLS